MASQIQPVEHKTSPQRRPAKPVAQGPVAPAPDLVLLQRAVADPGAASPRDILALQRVAGNRAVTRLIQAKLTVGPAGDKYEQEADRVADQVVSDQRSAASGQPSAVPQGGFALSRQAEEEEEIQTKPLAASITPLLQRQAEEEEEVQTLPSPAGRGGRGEGEVQRRADAGFDAGPGVVSRLAANKGGGSPLPGEVRAAMEPCFGVDFGGVRIHTGGEADHLNRQLSAQAFTHGQDIYMAAGKFAPGTPGGNRLLAHELTHVIQQTGRKIERKLSGQVSESPDGRVVQLTAGPVRGSAGQIQRRIVTQAGEEGAEDLVILGSIGAYLGKRPADIVETLGTAQYNTIGSDEPLYIIAHGSPATVGDKSDGEMADELTAKSRALPKAHQKIGLAACEAGKDVGLVPSYARRLQQRLRGENYSHVKVTGPPEVAITNIRTVTEMSVKPAKVGEAEKIMDRVMWPELKAHIETQLKTEPSIKQRAKKAISHKDVKFMFEAFLKTKHLWGKAKETDLFK